jgi:hypothetical protein
MKSSGKNGDLPTITNETDLLELMQEAPERRVLSGGADSSVWVVEDHQGDVPAWGENGKPIAYVAEDLANNLADRAFAHNDFEDPHAPLIYKWGSAFMLNIGNENGG